MEDKPTTLTFTYGIANLTLKHGQKVIIKNLPNHCRYEVLETSVEGYTSTVAGTPNSTDMTEDTDVDYTNTAAIAPPTGFCWKFGLMRWLCCWPWPPRCGC